MTITDDRLRELADERNKYTTEVRTMARELLALRSKPQTTEPLSVEAGDGWRTMETKPEGVFDVLARCRDFAAAQLRALQASEHR